MENNTMFGKGRFSQRLIAMAWTIIETRDPEFDREKLKKEIPVVVILKATSFATTEENEVMKELIGMGDSDEKNELSEILGALEGKKVIYEKKDVKLLLKSEDVI